MTFIRFYDLRALPLTLSLLAAAACGGTTVDGGKVGGDDTDDSGVSTTDGGGGDDDASNVDASAPDSAVPDSAAPFGAIPLNSCVPTVYTAPITIGGSQQFQLTIDTGSGSTSLGVASSSCTNCGVSPEYTPGASATNENQTASSQYGTGSWSGAIYQDSVAGGTVAATPVKFVGIDSQSHFFESIQCDSTNRSTQGIIGLGPTSVALQGTTGYVDALVANEGMPDVFAIELCDDGGTLWLGGYDSSATTAAVEYTPFTTDVVSEYYYTVGLTSLTVNGTTVPVASGQYADTLVDTGTSAFLLGTTAYSALTSALASDSSFASIFGGASFFSGESCKSVSQTKAELDAMLPAITLTFASGITVTTNPTDSYLFEYGAGSWCPALASETQSENEFPFASILGAPMLRSNITVFDRAQRRVGFAPHTACP